MKESFTSTKLEKKKLVRKVHSSSKLKKSTKKGSCKSFAQKKNSVPKSYSSFAGGLRDSMSNKKPMSSRLPQKSKRKPGRVGISLAEETNRPKSNSKSGEKKYKKKIDSKKIELKVILNSKIARNKRKNLDIRKLLKNKLEPVVGDRKEVTEEKDSQDTKEVEVI